MKAWVAEKVFQYRHDNVCKQGFLSMLSFHSAANMPVKENGNATKLVFKFATWEKSQKKVRNC